MYLAFIPCFLALGRLKKTKEYQVRYLLYYLWTVECLSDNLNDRDSADWRFWVTYLYFIRIRFYIWKIIVIIFTIIMFYILPYYILKEALFEKGKPSFIKRILLILLYLSYLLIANRILYYFKERDYRFFTFYLLTSQLIEYLGKAWLTFRPDQHFPFCYIERVRNNTLYFEFFSIPLFW